MNANNATSNDTQGEALVGMANSFVLEHRVRCFNHTLQLSAKALLCPFNAGLGNTPEVSDTVDIDDIPDLDTDDDDEGDNNNNNNNNDREALLAASDMDGIDDGIDKLDALDADAREKVLADTAAVCGMVTKIRHLSFAVIWSTTIALPACCRYCKKLKLKPCILPRDVVTCWNSTFYMLNFAIKYHSVIDAITVDKTLKLRKFKLETDEWSIAKDLVAILRQYRDVTLFFSLDSAGVATVIPAMDRITNGLNYQTGKVYHPSITVAMKLAHKKLDRYYSLTDNSTVYRIAMVLHPGIKLEYFCNQK
jgi:hypothetical protein